MEGIEILHKKFMCLWFQLSLSNKIAVTVLSLVLAVLGLSQMFLFSYVNSYLHKQISSTTKSNLIQTEKSIKVKTNSIIERALYLQLNDTFNTSLKKILFSDGPVSDVLSQSRIALVLAQNKIADPLISSFFLYTEKGDFTDMTVFMEEGYQFKESDLYKLAEEMKNNSIDWGVAGRDEIFINHKMVIPMLCKFRIEGINSPLILVVNIDQQRLNTYLSTIRPNPNMAMMIVDQAGNAVASSNSELTKYILQDQARLNQFLDDDIGETTLEYLNERYLIASHTLERLPWFVVSAQSERDLFGDLVHLRNFFILSIIGVICLLCVLIISVVRKTTKPLLNLSQAMKQVEKQNYSIRFSYPHSDEVGVLSESFNSMLAETQRLIISKEEYIEQLKEEKENVRREQMLKRRIELNALQSQINSHFLYNTLDSIRWKAEAVHASEISSMVTSLATLFRISLSRGREIIPILDEIKHVQSYLAIQKFRYGDKIDYEILVDEAVKPLYAIKLTLQPLVENAIYHGIKEKDGSGKVIVSVEKFQNDIKMTVKDDGVGIPGRRLQMLQDALSKGDFVRGDGYGIFNVQERIRLFFGNGYGLTLQSREREGTVVELILPCITEEEVEKYVPNPDS